MPTHSYFHRRKSYRKKYYPEGHQNLYIPNGIKDFRTLLRKYFYLLNIIENNGKIIDFGCGNGMMLKFVVQNTECKLIPFGVDFLPESIKQAKTKIFPEFKENFVCMNIIDYDFSDNNFNYILIDPAYLFEDDWNYFYEKCMNNLNKGGHIILYISPDEFLEFNFKKRMGEFLKYKKGFKNYIDDSILIFFKKK